MENLSIAWFEISVVVSLTTAIVAVLQMLRSRSYRRTIELRTAKRSLEAHYDAVDDIVNDPALPDSAREMIVNFTEVLSNRELCRQFVSHFMSLGNAKFKEGPTPVWAADMDKLRRSRPDLVERFRTAQSSGLVTIFLRWQDNAPKFYEFSAEIAANQKRGTQIADQVSRLKKTSANGKNDKAPHGTLAIPC